MKQLQQCRKFAICFPFAHLIECSVIDTEKIPNRKYQVFFSVSGYRNPKYFGGRYRYYYNTEVSILWPGIRVFVLAPWRRPEYEGKYAIFVTVHCVLCVFLRTTISYCVFCAWYSGRDFPEHSKKTKTMRYSILWNIENSGIDYLYWKSWGTEKVPVVFSSTITIKYINRTFFIFGIHQWVCCFLNFNYRDFNFLTQVVTPTNCFNTLLQHASVLIRLCVHISIVSEVCVVFVQCIFSYLSSSSVLSPSTFSSPPFRSSAYKITLANYLPLRPPTSWQ